ncbi:unnamed protein product [Ectocarpus sp. 13 AM-2016]
MNYNTEDDSGSIYKIDSSSSSSSNRSVRSRAETCRQPKQATRISFSAFAHHSDEHQVTVDPPQRCSPSRWPTPQSVRSSSGYLFYACEAGDSPGGSSPERASIEGRNQRSPRRGRQRRQRRQRRRRRQPSNQQNREQDWPRSNRGKKSSRTDNTGSQQCPSDPNRGWNVSNNCGFGNNLRGGLPVLVGDIRGAMVAVWLAWGVRIDAVREKLRRQKRRLQAVHRAEVAKLERSTHPEAYIGVNGIDRMTPKVLDCIVREAALRQTGESEQANGVKREALRARKQDSVRGKYAWRYRKPMLESGLRERQGAKLLAIRNAAESLEAQLVRARDETVRLLQLHLSRAQRIIASGVARTAGLQTGCPVGASPVLREADFVKLGNVLLHAQETASCSIKRALQTNGHQSASAVSNIPDDEVHGNACGSTLAVTAARCLWCDAALADTGTLFRRYGNAGGIQAITPYNRMRTATARHHCEGLQQPHRRLARDNQYPTPSRHRPRDYKHREDTEMGEGPGTRRSCDQAPPPSPTENTSSNQAAVVEHSSSPNMPLGAREHVLFDQDGGDYATPGALFCSWGCARKWNDRFSPLQTRHERGLRIDIAAGRVVRR